MQNQSYLITGGAGFIGSHLVDKLLSQGKKVSVLDDLSTGFEKNLAHIKSPAFRFIKGSFCERPLLFDLIAQHDAVIHVGALPSVSRSVSNPLPSHDTNMTGTLNVLEGARLHPQLNRLVMVSSSSVYGNTPTLPKNEDMAGHPLSPYALQKWASEEYMRLYAKLYGLPAVAIRPFNVFGPRQNPFSEYSAVIPRWVVRAKKNEDLLIFGDGKQTRDFTFVANIVDLLIRASEAPLEQVKGLSFNGGCGDRIDLNQLAQKIIDLTGSSSKIQYEAPRAGDIRDSLAGLSLAEKHLGYRPLVSLDEGLHQLIDSMKDKS